ncbi:MAG: hypothetical protein E7474_08410 [Ruminococcaceae bacterium]|nr:hypothetical protein [Oscillospiraceae bacterium]
MASKRFAGADRERCGSCGACTHECPRGAIQIWHGCFAVIDAALCVGCGRPSSCSGHSACRGVGRIRRAARRTGSRSSASAFTASC